MSECGRITVGEVLGLDPVELSRPRPPAKETVRGTEAIASLIGRIRELERCEFLLDQVLATLCMDRNRQCLRDDPKTLDLLFEICDMWRRQRGASKNET